MSKHSKLRNPWNLLLILGLLALPPAARCAQGQDLNHSVNFPTGDAAWTVRLDQPSDKRNRKDQAEDESAAADTQEVSVDAAAAAGKEPEIRRRRSVDVVRKDGVRRDRVTWTDQTVTEYWWPKDSSVMLFKARPEEPVRTMRTSSVGLRNVDQSLFSWVGQKTFQKVQRFRGKKCLLYTHQMPLPGDSEPITVSAWIDQASGRPLAWSDGKNVAVFEFDKPVPMEPLVLPAEIAERARSVQAYLNPRRVQP